MDCYVHRNPLMTLPMERGSPPPRSHPLTSLMPLSFLYTSSLSSGPIWAHDVSCQEHLGMAMGGCIINVDEPVLPQCGDVMWTYRLFSTGWILKALVMFHSNMLTVSFPSFRGLPSMYLNKPPNSGTLGGMCDFHSEPVQVP